MVKQGASHSVTRMRLRLGRSYWLDVFKGRASHWAPLRGRHSADVAIIGGGITGCAAAWLFARAGARVVLVDAARIGRGSTAASTALLMQEPDVDFVDLARRYGRATSIRMWQCASRAVTDLKDALEELGVSSVESLPSVYIARDPRQLPRLDREARARRHVGLRGRSLNARGVRDVTGVAAAGGILTSGNACVDPYEACLAFAREAGRHGARLYEHSRVRAVEACRTGATLRLDDGTISVDRAIVATGYATPEFEPLAARFRMMNTYVITTPTLDAALRRRVGLTDAMVWDSDRPYHYLRWTPDHRLLFGGLDRPKLPAAIRPAVLGRRADMLMADLKQWYPALEGVRPEYAWEGLFAKTPDGLPYIGAHRRYPRQLFALGYGGNGMTLGFFAAKALVRIAQGRPGPCDGLFGFGRTRH
jgi:glycine/D-amino acid oxidase-like deaminating enzyme